MDTFEQIHSTILIALSIGVSNKVLQCIIFLLNVTHFEIYVTDIYLMYLREK